MSFTLEVFIKKKRNCMLLVCFFYHVKCGFYNVKKIKIKEFNESHDDCVGCIFSSSSSTQKVGEDEVCVGLKEGGGGVCLQTQMSPPDPTKKQKEDGADWPCNCKNICALLHLKQP